ncbi:MAG: glycosyltransferase [Ginsengibacter sp.]
MPDAGYQKIAFVAGTLGIGGAERQLYYLASTLQEKGYSVTVYCLTQKEYYESKLAAKGIDVIFFGRSKSKLRRAYQLYKLLKANPPDLVYSFHFYTNIYGSIAAKILRIKMAGSIRSNGIAEKKANGLLSWLHYMLPDCIIANSKHGADNCEKIFYKKKLFVLGNVIRENLFRFAPKKINKDECLRIIWVGRLTPVKQPHLFPLLIKHLRDLGLAVEGHMYGDGNLKDDLVNLLNTNYHKYPVFLYSSHQKIQDVYKDAHWLCSTSKFEGTSNVVIEAMASGVAIASLQYQGIGTLIDNQVNGLVEKDITQLANGIHDYSEDDRYSSLLFKARQEIELHYSFDSLVTSFEEILFQI